MMSVYGCRTKKDLRSKVGGLASSYLMETSMFGPELRDNGKFAVVGPGPYERKWYAQMTVADRRIVKVS